MTKFGPLCLPAFCVCLMALAMQTAPGGVRLSPLFGDNMVLQRSEATRIWGRADAAEQVSVRLGTASAAAQAGTDGYWELLLDLSDLGQGPYRLTVQGNNLIEFDNVLVGDVWFASGQSNMEFPLIHTSDAAAELASGAGSGVRHFRMARVASETPLENVEGEWTEAVPGKIAYLSAVAYYFAKTWNEATGNPVGVIEGSWSGTAIEPWLSVEAMAQTPYLADMLSLRRKERVEQPLRVKAFTDSLLQWVKRHRIEDKRGALGGAFAANLAEAWEPVALSLSIHLAGSPAAGVVWLRTVVDIPEHAAGADLYYRVQEGRGYASFYFNGEHIGGVEEWTANALQEVQGEGASYVHVVPASLVRAGQNVLAVRVYSPLGAGGIGPLNTLISSLGNFSIDLGGSQWFAKTERSFPMSVGVLARAPAPPAAASDAQYEPAFLYNGMVAPIVKATISGIIWYQGESNVGNPVEYEKSFLTLITTWRQAWGGGALPFYFCQLAAYSQITSEPGESWWARLREAQASVLRLPATGQAVLLDVGEADDIHPRNKKTVGERLAQIALQRKQQTANARVTAEGPVLEATAISSDKVYLKFLDTGSGSALRANALSAPVDRSNGASQNETLTAQQQSQLQGFSICGADRKWVWAEARIETPHSIVVWSDQVRAPIAVRYAWSDNPVCNLYNEDGYPASGFRTDQF